MKVRDRVLVIRRLGGLGDQICATIAVRAAMEKYGAEFDVHAVVGRRHWQQLFVDQKYCTSYLDSAVARQSVESLNDQFAYVADLDGPEYRRANRTQWAPQNRTETWCSAVDHMPADLCPHWRPRPDESEWARQYVTMQFGNRASDLHGAPLIIIQALPDPGMPWKRWPYMPQLAIRLVSDYRVLVLHDRPLAEYAETPGFVFECGLDLRQLGSVLSLAGLVIAPDSAFIHFAAAVDVPCLGIFGGTSGAVTCAHYSRARWLQAPIDPDWKCAAKAPCAGMAVRDFWCSSRPDFNSMAACMERVSIEKVITLTGNMLKDRQNEIPKQADRN